MIKCCHHSFCQGATDSSAATYPTCLTRRSSPLACSTVSSKEVPRVTAVQNKLVKFNIIISDFTFFSPFSGNKRLRTINHLSSFYLLVQLASNGTDGSLLHSSRLKCCAASREQACCLYGIYKVEARFIQSRFCLMFLQIFFRFSFF